MAARPAPPPPRRKPHRLLEKAAAPHTAEGASGGQARGSQGRSRQPPAPPAAGRGRRRSDVSADPPRRHLARRPALRGPPRPAPAALPGMGLCGRAWARCGGPGVLWGLALGRGFPRPCRTGGWELPRAEGTARYGLWAAAGGGVPAPRGVRGLRSSNPFTRRQEEEWRRRNRSTLAYIAAAAVGMVGMSYAAVPLYRLYCQATGLGGTTGAGHSSEQIESMEPVRDRVIRVTFNADVHSSIQWNFKPQQSEIYVVPGETALAFYKAKNPTDKPIIGISTYNVIPFEAGQYFNKIQCFCFEEQRLNPQEEVDMPVFFYIDPEFAEDPKMAKVDLITLSYTFFEAKEGQKLALPGYQ
uniref:Cytochrome c oxidase assembly protein COX11, mitochondrial n=3 Tax=Accipitrinae TaxID=8955 RepID=A0A8B9N4P6_9AVES